MVLGRWQRLGRRSTGLLLGLVMVAAGCVTIGVPPSDDAVLTPSTPLRGVAEAPDGVDQVRISIRDRGTGLWWDPPNQQWRQARKWFPAALADRGATRTRWSVSFDPTDTSASGLYRIFSVTRSPSGLSGATSQRFRIPAGYDLSTLGLSNARYRAGGDVIVTTKRTRSRVMMPSVDAAPPGGRTLAVELTTRPGQSVKVAANWTTVTGNQPSLQRSRVHRLTPKSSRQVVTIDLDGMGAATGPLRLRVDGGARIHYLALVDAPPPNVVFILTDDMRSDEFEMGFNRSLPRPSALETHLIDAGATLPNLFTTTPLCCPSRASFLTGQYAHNHFVYGNSGTNNAFGGLPRFYNDDRDLTSLGTWLQTAGYETALVGKYLNGYPNKQRLDQQGLTENYVPRGWDEWYASFTNDDPFSYYDFRFNENGQVVDYDNNYLTSVEERHAVDYIRRRAGHAPFFLYLNTYGPHGPFHARDDHIGEHWTAGVEPSSTPACDETDLSDKPAYIRDEPDLDDHNGCWAEALWSRRLDMTLSTDELIDSVVRELDRQGVLDNTYVILTSDNGMLRGEHHIEGKTAPYEESIRVPMVIRGPGIEPGVTLDHLVANIDLAPTILELAGATPNQGSPAVDGESLLPVLTEGLSTAQWRQAVLIELLVVGTSTNQPHVVPRYAGVRTADHVLIEYDTGEIELYDLRADPFQLDSIHASAPAGLLGRLQSQLSALRDCDGAGCAAAARAG
ncbi:MAG: sulfatase family protein [Acidimicrobiales bacterium]